MAKSDDKKLVQKAPLIKSKIGPGLGFRTPDHFKGKTFGQRPVNQGFNPSTFKTQHKG